MSESKQESWLIASLEDSVRRAEEIPSWAKMVNAAVEAYYGVHASADERNAIDSTVSPTQAEAAR